MSEAAATSGNRDRDKPTRLMPLAQVMRAQGRRGEVLAMPLTDIAAMFVVGANVYLAAAEDGPATETRALDEVWWPTGKNAGRAVLKLRGIDSITDAEAAAGRFVLVDAGALPALEPDTYFVRDLAGCVLIEVQTGEVVGTVVDVEYVTSPDGRSRLADAAPLLVVERTPARSDSNTAAEPALVPFVRALLREVDLTSRRIVMELPAGLLTPTEDDDDDGQGGDVAL